MGKVGKHMIHDKRTLWSTNRTWKSKTWEIWLGNISL